MKSEDCPRFHTCLAAVCPLDVVPSIHLPGERVCYYLLNSGKDGAAERFEDDPVFSECVSRLPEIAERFPEIGRKVETASQSGFRGQNFSGKRPVTPTKAFSGAL